ncbi:MAG TPA: RNA 2',3'-cyclic phosphodiesterase [Candidatus Acidoferrales bacterium]|jgi:2'-5' RNA ligase|nr:RNA 2',3'-cyclic phosphodiesterase [Candidatus Acidoferrales bacterium]
MKPTETLRLFLAIPLPDDVRAELRRLQSDLQPLLPPRAVRWTKPEQFHLTLKFLGSVPAAETDALSRAVRAVCDTAPPMCLRAEGAGFFPDSYSPRVFWVDIKSVDGRLQEFQRQLELAVQSFAEKEDPKNSQPMSRLLDWRNCDPGERKSSPPQLPLARLLENG